MDHQVDNIKLTKYGFHLDLLKFSSFLSILGIVFSIIGLIGSIAAVFLVLYASGLTKDSRVWGLYLIIFCLIAPYLGMWIFLTIKTNKQDIPGIEKIGKVYSYVFGSLEIIYRMVQIYAMITTITAISDISNWVLAFTTIIGSVIYIFVACAKIHGIRVENNQLLGEYLGIRYVLFILDNIFSIIKGLVLSYSFLDTTARLIVPIIFFILDIGLTVILHSIRVNRESSAGTENPMKNF